MKRIRLLLFTTLVAVSVLVLAGCKRAGEAEEAKAATEVAVQVGKVIKTNLRARVEAYGIVEPEPAQDGHPGGGAKLAAPAAGLVMAVPVKEGEHVEAGTVIVKLDDRLALSTLALAEQQFKRQKKLTAIEGTSEKAFQESSQQLAAARAQLALVQLATPLSGVVARINVQPGQAVDQNTVVAEIVDPGRLVVTANVPAAEAASLKAGQPAELRAERDAQAAVQGKVLYVSPQVDARTATVLVRVSVPPDAGLRSGQFVQVNVITEEHDGKLAVPLKAIYTDHDGQTTLSIVEGDIAKQKVVKAGLRDGDIVEVEGDGVIEGATVVTVGSYALPKETKVRILNAQQEGK